MGYAERFNTPNFQTVDGNGDPYVGAQLFFYVTGTTTPLSTYSDVNLTVPNSNPIVADINGNFGSIWLGNTQAYKIQLYTPIPSGDNQSDSTPSNPLGTVIWTEDPCGPAATGSPTSTAGIIGEIRAFAGAASSVPTYWYLCYGQTISRTTYSSLYGVIGTTYGVGDGSTTFNLPDCRGRVFAYLDNMGGTAASRMTAGVCGIAATTLGGAGGDQNSQADTITASATTTCTVTDPEHSHLMSNGSTHAIVGVTSGGNAGLQSGGNINSSVTGTTSLASTGISVAGTTSVMCTTSLTGTAQNVQPTIMFNAIIYAGA